MKKSKKIALIVSAALIVTGIGIIIGALSSVGLDFNAWNTIEFTSKTHEIQEPFDSINILAAEHHVRIRPSDTDQCKVVCNDSEKLFHKIRVENNTLVITREDTRQWYEHIGFFWYDDLSVTVYLPEKEYQKLFIKNVSGDISVEGNLNCTEGEIYNTSGKIYFTGKIKNQLTLKTVSGDISVKGISEAALDVKSTSGDLLLSDVTADSLQLKTTSGDMELSSVAVKGQAQLESVSGEIELEGTDAGSFEIKTVSGNVDGHLLSSKDFEIHTTSGDVRVPDSDKSAGTCKIKTTSGNVKIKIQ